MVGDGEDDEVNQFIITGTLAGRQMKVLIDSGASISFMKTDLVKSMQLKVLHDKAINVTLGNFAQEQTHSSVENTSHVRIFSS